MELHKELLPKKNFTTFFVLYTFVMFFFPILDFTIKTSYYTLEQNHTFVYKFN